MILAAIGSGEYLPGMDAVDRVLLGRLPEPARVVCLPTAAGTEGTERINHWSQMGVDHFRRLGAQVTAVPIIDAASANDSTFAAQIAQANFVYLSGGKPAYLHQTLAGSHAWEAIQNVLAKGGVLAGCSAGAMVQGAKFFGFPGAHPGFNLLPDMMIIPHFDELPERMLTPARWFTESGVTIVGIDGFTALVKQGTTYEVLGRGGVTVWTKQEKTRYTHGRLPDGTFN